MYEKIIMFDLLIVQHITENSHSNGYPITSIPWDAGLRWVTPLKEMGEAEDAPDIHQENSSPRPEIVLL